MRPPDTAWSSPSRTACATTAWAPLAAQVEAAFHDFSHHLRTAVMGCVGNGPGEAREADLGVSCGNGKGWIFRQGEVLRTDRNRRSSMSWWTRHYLCLKPSRPRTSRPDMPPGRGSRHDHTDRLHGPAASPGILYAAGPAGCAGGTP
ncbi:flavodoxin-dependent (E)-4-hydroxy-3-methylbut-2-enyl-diphosphate synthase [Streptomyces cyaneus]|uniref:flavodoxin-dependent (E)-4-hydroxy-3-methylbut-2-enyl-diphosphate synthase n=1 Tax=Streptomyces cyaneus TaxID=1904 RepID=UPI003CCC4F7C